MGGSRFRRKEWVRRVWPMRRRERSVSWYRVREVDGSRDSALGLIGRSLEVCDHWFSHRFKQFNFVQFSENFKNWRKIFKKIRQFLNTSQGICGVMFENFWREFEKTVKKLLGILKY